MTRYRPAGTLQHGLGHPPFPPDLDQVRPVERLFAPRLCASQECSGTAESEAQPRTTERLLYHLSI
jgi:hypothetical protein